MVSLRKDFSASTRRVSSSCSSTNLEKKVIPALMDDRGDIVRTWERLLQRWSFTHHSRWLAELKIVDRDAPRSIPKTSSDEDSRSKATSWMCCWRNRFTCSVLHSSRFSTNRRYSNSRIRWSTRSIWRPTEKYPSAVWENSACHWLVVDRGSW